MEQGELNQVETQLRLGARGTEPSRDSAETMEQGELNQVETQLRLWSKGN